MTDKQIIINGVDVSGCECYNPNIKMDCLLHPLQSDACKNNPNCHYKLYKRKEQECEIWKNQILTIDDETITVQITQQQFEEYNQLKTENEKLDTENKRLVAELANPVFDSFEELDKLKQTLTEIKEIAENVQSFVGRINIEDDVFEQMEQILQKISECEVEDAR